MTARAPLAAALGPYVGSLWVGHSVRARREHVIPSGEMHLAVRIDGPPLQLYAGRGDRAGQAIDTAVVCGARSRYYAKRTEPGCTVGLIAAAGNPQANDEARKIADEKAKTFQCGKDRRVTSGDVPAFGLVDN